MTRLSAATFTRLPYDRSGVAVGHAHIGVGAFHRAHQAEFADDLLALAPGPWGIVGINLRPPDLTAMLAPQDCLYSRTTRDGTDENTRVIGAIRRVAMGHAAGLAALADPAVSVVTLTVTEKGLCHIPATGVIDTAHPDIVHDAASPATPRSAPGLLVAMLAARRASGLPPPALLSCDNIPSNGRVLRAVVTGLAGLRDPALANWIDREVAFPDSMVDRIVPATGDADRDGIALKLGLCDEAAVVCEPFRQWVIEDAFRGPRPPWERVGVEVVPDVRPYEAMKMRLLNGCQSALSYLGWLGGCEHTADAMATPELYAYARDLMALETGPTVSIGVDLAAYQGSVLRRLANTALRHTTWQIATDGSQKIAQRLLAPLRARLDAGAPFPRLALGVAAFMQFVSGRDLRGRSIEVPDPLAPVLSDAASGTGTPAELVRALLRVTAIFGDDLHRSAAVEAAITHALTLLRDVGPIQAARVTGNA